MARVSEGPLGADSPRCTRPHESPKIEGLGTESEANVQWTESAAQGTIPKPQKGRYGAVGQSF
jgi:hypothetical protein